MAENMDKPPSKRGPISKIRPSDGCKGDTVPLAVERWYDFHGFGCHLGNVGSYASSPNYSWRPSDLSEASGVGRVDGGFSRWIFREVGVDVRG